VQLEGFVEAPDLILLAGDNKRWASYLSEALEVAFSGKARLSKKGIMTKADAHGPDARNEFSIGGARSIPKT
jgi:hypothetical protein